MDKLINDILTLFKGRTDRIGGVARGRSMHFKILNPNQEMPRYLLRHLKGHQRIGFYNFLSDGTCYWALLEFEKKDNEKQNLEDAFLLKRTLTECGMRSYIERSSSDTGFRLWIFFDSPASSTLLREALHIVLHKLKLEEHVNIYPTEEKSRAEEGACGEFAWLPFFGDSDIMGKGLKHGHTLFLDDSKKVIPIDMAIELIKTNDPMILPDIITYFSERPTREIKKEIEKLEMPPEKKEEIIQKEEPVHNLDGENQEMNDSVLDNMLIWLTSDTFSPIPTGFKSLDLLLDGGLQNSKLTEIKGGNSVERTIFSLQIADQIASYNSTRQLPVVIFYISRRFDREELILKSLSRTGELNEVSLESKKWKSEPNADDFMEQLHGTISIYQSYAHWIKVVNVRSKIDIDFIESAAKQLSYKFNTPHIVMIIEDPFLIFPDDKVETVIKLRTVARDLNIPLLIINDGETKEDMDGMISVSIELNTSGEAINNLIKDKKSRCAIKLEERKEELKKFEKQVILRVYKEKNDSIVLLPFIMKKVYNQFVEI
jgi:hypothetical protein